MSDAYYLAQQLQERERVKREKMRVDYPECAAHVDELRAAGFEPRVRYAEEGGQFVGKLRSPGVSPVLPMAKVKLPRRR